jgi:ribosomal protein S18 acetylase RimI-like enzyme
VSSLAGPVDVRPVRPDELERLQEIGTRAGRVFADVDDPVVAACADDPPLDLERLAQWCRAGRAWAAEVDDAVVGFVVVDLLDGRAHIEEVAVDPLHGGRGIGRGLVEAVIDYASQHGLDGITLTTFSEVPWNRPWYERLGFRVMEEPDLGPGLRTRRAEEAAAGLDPGRRVCMIR